MKEFSLEGLGLRTVGRPKKLQVLAVRELSRGDLDRLEDERGSKAPEVMKLRERHHALARLLAQGISPGHAAIMTGYSGSRVSILQGDTAFQELVKFYRDAEHERYQSHKQMLSDISQETLQQIQDRLENDAEEIPLTTLMDIGKLALDRSGFGPSSKTEVDVRVGLSDKLAAARKRVAQDRAALARDVTPKEND